MPGTTPGAIRMTVATGPEWKRVEAELRRQSATLAENFRNEIREVGETLSRQAAEEVMRIPTYTSKHSGLRTRVAQGVGTKLTKTGVQITTSMNDKDEINIPAYLDINRGWRHPVFGNRHVWVEQETGGNWFRETIATGQPMIQRRMEEIFEDAAETIGRAGN